MVSGPAKDGHSARTPLPVPPKYTVLQWLPPLTSPKICVLAETVTFSCSHYIIQIHLPKCSPFPAAGPPTTAGTSLNHSMTWVGRDLKDHLISIPLP